MDVLTISDAKFDCSYSCENNTNKKFKIVKLIGKGSFGKVYLARDTYHGKDVVIKIMSMRKNYAKNEIDWYIKLVGYEKIKPYIPNLYHVYDDGDNYYIVMEYVIGTCLSSTLTMGRTLRLAQIVELLEQILNIMERFHKEKIVLNDIKPENIMIDLDGKIKFIDFGLLTQFDDKKQINLGSPIFIPPENYTNKRMKSNDKKDIWSFGITVVEFLTNDIFMDNVLDSYSDSGHVTFKSEMYSDAKKDMFCTLDSLYKRYSIAKGGIQMKYIVDILKWCLEDAPNDRPTASEILQHKLFKKKKYYKIRSSLFKR